MAVSRDKFLDRPCVPNESLLIQRDEDLIASGPSLHQT
jgi:hypothetical protein